MKTRSTESRKHYKSSRERTRHYSSHVDKCVTPTISLAYHPANSWESLKKKCALFNCYKGDCFFLKKKEILTSAL
jgi:hypothetical protein